MKGTVMMINQETRMVASDYATRETAKQLV